MLLARRPYFCFIFETKIVQIPKIVHTVILFTYLLPSLWLIGTYIWNRFFGIVRGERVRTFSETALNFLWIFVFSRNLYTFNI